MTDRNPAPSPDRAEVPGLPVYAEAVLDVVEALPVGRVTTYGRIADLLREAGLGGGPRAVGAVLARYGGAVPWWRVLPADGSPPGCDPDEASRRWREEGTPVRAGRGTVRADLPRALGELTLPGWVGEL